MAEEHHDPGAIESGHTIVNRSPSFLLVAGCWHQPQPTLSPSCSSRDLRRHPSLQLDLDCSGFIDLGPSARSPGHRRPLRHRGHHDDLHVSLDEKRKAIRELGDTPSSPRDSVNAARFVYERPKTRLIRRGCNDARARVFDSSQGNRSGRRGKTILLR